MSAALHRALTPMWERIFLPCSYGFRPGRNTWDMLADMEWTMIHDDRWVIATDDIRNAFDQVDYVLRTRGTELVLTKRISC